MQRADSVWQTTLQNGNPVLHPAITPGNAAQIERTGGDFLFYEEGVTPAVGRLVRPWTGGAGGAGHGVGVTVLRDPELGILQGYQAEDNYSSSYSRPRLPAGIRAQPQLDYRYFNEDAGFGLVFLTDLGRQIGVPTPTMDAVLQVCSVLMGRDYAAEAARTMAGLGLSAAARRELRGLL